jgi:hypothetical protein
MDNDREDGGPLMDTTALPPTIGADDDVIAPAPAPAAAAIPRAHPSSILEQLRSVREHEQADDELVLRLPMYDDRIALVMRYPESGFEAFEKIGTRAATSKDPLATLKAACETIALCCVDVRGVDENGELVALDGDATRGPLRIGPELASLLGIEVPPAVRDARTLIVRHLYSPRAHATGVFRGDVAIVTDYGRLTQFVNDGAVAAQDRFVGE